MNEKLSYASMLEIPVNTSSVTYKPLKRRLKKKKPVTDTAKEELIQRINAETTEATETQPLVSPDYLLGEDNSPNAQETPSQGEENQTSSVNITSGKPKKKGLFKLSAITVQLIIIGVLIATIFITNSIYPNSGLNVFMRSVFGIENATQVDDREYSEFSPVFANENVTFAEGILTVHGEGSVYSSVDGEVDSITQEEDGSFTLQVSHSTNFFSIISGLEHVYVSEGGKVYSTIPVGYVSDSVQMCFTNANGGIISDFQVLDGVVIWAV